MNKEKRKIGELPIDEMKQEVTDFINEVRENEPVLTESFESVESPEYSEATFDEEEKVLSYRKKDGTKVENVGLETPKIKTKEINTQRISTDSLNLSEDGMTEFQQALKDSGFNPGGAGDFSDASEMYIPIPRIAFANITSPSGQAVWPWSKPGRHDFFPGVSAELKYYMEFYDGAGNYFKKEIIFSAQGNSSMYMIKKNGSADFCNNNGWDDEDTFKIKFGDWVPQDSFHFKAYYTDYLRGTAACVYKIANEIYKTRGFFEDRPWKKALIDFDDITDVTPTNRHDDGIKDVDLQIDNGARCMPDGFPTVFFLNGEFYGIYSWQLKKHRDNYHMKKSKPKHIHLDGDLTIGNLWGGNVNWSGFEIRNPKNLVWATADIFNEYDETVTYPIEAIVRNSNRTKVYKSRSNNNVGNPLTDTSKWAEIASSCYKYDADVVQAEIAGNSDGSSSYDVWAAGAYPLDKIVEHGGHLFMNIVPNNNAEPIYDSKKNADDAPDFKNKTGCGWLNVTNTVKVKEYIINFSKRIGEINDMAKNVVKNSSDQYISITNYLGHYSAEFNYERGDWVVDNEGNYYLSLHHTDNINQPLTDTHYWFDITTIISDIRATFETYFDSDNVVDYQIINMAVRDSDAFNKNWQWITYDGVKWYVCQYDKDYTFGNTSGEGFIFAPITGWVDSNLGKPSGVAIKYFMAKHKARWQELINSKVISVDNFMSKLNDWIARFGQENYEKEWEKWPDSPCNRDSLIDFENWTFTGQFSQTEPNTWSDDNDYSEGDKVWYKPLPDGRSYQFEANQSIAAHSNKPPLTGIYPDKPQLMGFRDNIWRFRKFMMVQLEIQNEFFNNLNV